MKVHVVRRGGFLDLRFVLEGDMARVVVPALRPPGVGEGLWRHTCCELFLEEGKGSAYRELNFSPSGEWAAYAFSGYREGGPCAVPDPGIAVHRGPARLALEASVAAPAGRLRLGLSAVIEEAGGALAYWALAHPPGKPDFHHRAAFALELA